MELPNDAQTSSFPKQFDAIPAWKHIAETVYTTVWGRERPKWHEQTDRDRAGVEASRDSLIVISTTEYDSFLAAKVIKVINR